MIEEQDPWKALKDSAAIVACNAIVLVIGGAIWRWTLRRCRRLMESLTAVWQWIAGLE